MASVNGWVHVSQGLPEEDRPFLVFCPTLVPDNGDVYKCVAMGTKTTNGRGIGIRPAGPENYHLCNETTFWKYCGLPGDCK